MINPQIETFIITADAGSFTRAAEMLFISVPAVIKQINSLENNLGLKLFHRSHRGLTLTPAGQSLYADAKYLIQYSAESLRRAEAAAGVSHAAIRIGTSPITPASVLKTLWPQIHAIEPELNFQLIPFENTPENAREILSHLGQNIDMVAGIFDEVLLNSMQCAGLELGRKKLCCAVPVQNPLAAKSTLCVEDLHDHTLLFPISLRLSQTLSMLRRDLTEHHPDIRLVDFEFYNTEIFNRSYNENAVLITIDEWQDVHPLLKIIPVEWDYDISFGLMHAKKPAASVAACIRAIRRINPKV